MTQPKISIVVPSYNQGRFLEQTLLSLICQGYPNLEILVLDGGSTDESVAIIERYAPFLAFWRSQKDGGQAAAIAEGLGMATGEICAFLNSDDMLAKDSLDIVARAFTSSPAVNWVVGDTCLIDEMSRPYHYLREPYLLREWEIFVRNCIPQPSVFWRRSLYERNPGINPQLTYCMDSDLFFQFWRSDEPLMIRELLSYQRHHAQTKTAMLGSVDAVHRVGEREYLTALEKYLGFSGSRSRAARLLWRCHRIAVKSWRLQYVHAVLFALPRARRDLAFVSNGIRGLPGGVSRGGSRTGGRRLEDGS